MSLEIFITGSHDPSAFSRAHILYTPPKAGVPSAVMQRVPMPQDDTVQPCSLSEAIAYSSKSFDPEMIASGKPAAAKSFDASRDRYDKSPLSIRIPYFAGSRPSSRNFWKTRIAFGTPLPSTSYVSASKIKLFP